MGVVLGQYPGRHRLLLYYPQCHHRNFIMSHKINVSIAGQTLYLSDDGEIVREYSVSTARNGAGEVMGSECTPTGRHVIAEKFGADCAPNTVFVERRATGEVYGPKLRQSYPGRDWILTRILWLSGEEPGRNQGGELDSYRRYIYIHGAPADVEMGKPGSRGCIRMRNEDVIELFDLVAVGTEALIDA